MDNDSIIVLPDDTSLQQGLKDGIPDKVTAREFREALENYAVADRDWKEYAKRRYLAAKEDAGEQLFRLAKALLKNKGFYTYRDAVVDSMAGDEPSPNPEDYE